MTETLQMVYTQGTRVHLAEPGAPFTLCGAGAIGADVWRFGWRTIERVTDRGALCLRCKKARNGRDVAPSNPGKDESPVARGWFG